MSRAEAARIVADYIIPKLEERGARVPINVTRYELAGKERITYWIG